MKIYALIVAAGCGARLGSDIPKQYMPLGAQSVLEYSLTTFLTHPNIEDVQLIVSRAHEILYCPIVKKYTLMSPVEGGETRSDSVRAGLKPLQEKGATHVLIHDAARPFLSHSLIDHVIERLKSEQAIIPVLPCVDTIKTGKKYVEKTIDRSLLKRVQTPQGFHLNTLMDAYTHDESLTDEAQAMENANVPVKMIEGDENLFKITTPYDYERAQNMREKNGRKKTKVGQGFDVHRLIEGDGVTLGGIKIPCNLKLKGHSDADVVLHALVDAILGAIGKGDIGEHFSPTDKRWKGADSSLFVKSSVQWMKEAGYRLQNADITIICEVPKIAPYKEKMRQNIAALLMIEEDDVNIKATTTEELGFTGRGEGIAAQAIVSVYG